MIRKVIFVIFICLLQMTVSFAKSKDLKKDITMVSYEQSWLDSYGTLALKNNTKVEIKNISFVITYLDMSGNELDYEEFYQTIRIKPGKTKKLNIPAYEHERQYHYYKTKDDLGNPAFKIKFQLKDYNIIAAEPVYSGNNYNSMDNYPSNRTGLESYHNDGTGELIAFIICLLLIIVYLAFYPLVAVMAKERNRNIIVWIVLSFLTTPILIAIILLCIGNDEKKSN